MSFRFLTFSVGTLYFFVFLCILKVWISFKWNCEELLAFSSFFLWKIINGAQEYVIKSLAMSVLNSRTTYCRKTISMFANCRCRFWFVRSQLVKICIPFEIALQSKSSSIKLGCLSNCTGVNVSAMRQLYFYKYKLVMYHIFGWRDLVMLF